MLRSCVKLCHCGQLISPSLSILPPASFAFLPLQRTTLILARTRMSPCSLFRCLTFPCKLACNLSLFLSMKHLFIKSALLFDNLHQLTTFDCPVLVAVIRSSTVFMATWILVLGINGIIQRKQDCQAVESDMESAILPGAAMWMHNNNCYRINMGIL